MSSFWSFLIDTNLQNEAESWPAATAFSLTQKTLVFSMDFGAENNEIKKRTNLGAQFWDVVNLRTSRIWRIIWRTIFIGVFSSLMWYIYVPSAFNTICPVLVVKPNFSQVQNIIPLFLSQTAVIKVSQSLTIKLKRGFCWRCRLNETIHLTFSWRSSNLNESPPHPHPHPPNCHLISPLLHLKTLSEWIVSSGSNSFPSISCAGRREIIVISPNGSSRRWQDSSWCR